MDTPDDGRLVMFVADLPEQMKFDGDPETAHLVSDTYGGAWLGACVDGEPTIAFGLVDVRRADASPITWYLTNPPDEVVTAAATVPHLVAVIPSDAPGSKRLARTPEGR